MSLDSAPNFFEITPDDDNDLTHATRAIAFGTAGDLAVVSVDGDDDIIPSGVLAAGQMHPLRIRRVKSTGTTATDIWGFY